jgi:PucR C-terminal helix-turn-helix domain/GGDEF-like domain
MDDETRDSAFSFKAERRLIVEGLRARMEELDRAIYVRICDAVPDPVVGNKHEYQAGVRAAVTAIVGYSLDAIEAGPGWSAIIPDAATKQAQLAVRSGVGLGVVLRRYFAALGQFSQMVEEEADRAGLSHHGHVLNHLRRTQVSLLEHLAATIEQEYNQEHERLVCPAERRRLEVVQEVLAGESTGLSELSYEFDNVWHLGLIAIGAMAGKAVQILADRTGHSLLSVTYGDQTWAWLGGRRKLAASDIARLSSNGPAGTLFAVGASCSGLDGWRLTHQEAKAALSVAMLKPKKLTQCADVPLEAAVLLHEAVAQSLIGTYLLPLNNLRDGGLAARKTLRAYFAAGRNTSKAANALDVTRPTVENRLKAVATCLGRTLHTCYAELEIALRVEDLRTQR